MTEAAPEDDVVAQARRSLDRGDYGLVLRLLEPLAEGHSPLSREGTELRLLMVTAWMGLGQSERAVACCRTLRNCRDGLLRQQVRDLLEVLEAPALQRPRNWSLTLPDLPAVEPLEGLGTTLGRRRPGAQGPLEPPPPPVGPTRAPLGFAVLVALLVLLSVLLGGCMEVRTDLHFSGPGRVWISHHLRSSSGTSTPWQRGFAATLETDHYRSRSVGAEQVLRSPVLSEPAALASLRAGFEKAAVLAGVPLPRPGLHLEERNFLVGVRQDLRVHLDLQAVPLTRGLALSLTIEPLSLRAVRRAAPNGVAPIGPEAGTESAPGVLWPLQPGSVNDLEVNCWRWSPLGLGSVGIVLALLLTLALQRLRVRLGFGLPELPAGPQS